MTMQPEQTAFLLSLDAGVCEYEFPITVKVLAAIPAGKEQYSPDAKSMNALELAWHIASSEGWFLEGIARGQFPSEEGHRPAEITTVVQVVEWYNENAPAALAKVKALSPEQLAKPIDFFGLLNAPAVGYLSIMIRHSVHHRGQLAAYLRPMGGKVPSIYGGSADEPFQPPA